VADVLALATAPGPMKLRPAVTIEPDATLAQFDERAPEGADYVIVPAVGSEHVKDEMLAAWLREQSAKGATVVSICDGALVVAHAGLFKGHRATGHWYTRGERERDFPDTRWLVDTRYVADGAVISSAGVTAALPLAVALVEAIAGRDRAEQTARDVGLARWDNAHDSAPFHLAPRHYLTYARNAWLSSAEEIELAVAEGVDELALALTADSLGRTVRGRVHVAAERPVRTRHGLTVLPPGHAMAQPAAWRIDLATQPASGALDRTLDAIDARYGRATGDFVSLQLEYPR
jgi:putative intracellular protease/amidase